MNTHPSAGGIVRVYAWESCVGITLSQASKMAPRASTRAPTTAPIASTPKVNSTNRPLAKSLVRLSRSALIDLALSWLEKQDQPACAPYLASNRNLEEEAEEDYLWEPAESIEDLRKLYKALHQEEGKPRDVIDRILDGDWRRGLSLHQLATIDFAVLQNNESALRWTALKLVPLLAESHDTSPNPLKRKRKRPQPLYPSQVSPQTFIASLQSQISPLVKAHYFLHRLTFHDHNQPLSILRLYLSDSPYALPTLAEKASFTDASRTLYIAFPDSCPFVYVALSGSSAVGVKKVGPKVDINALKRVVLEAVPRALSRPHERWALETTALSAKSLATMCSLRGNGRGGAAQGAWSVFADGIVEGGVLDVVGEGNKKRKVLSERDINAPTEANDTSKAAKKRKTEVAKRFGTTGLEAAEHKAPLDRMHVRLEESVGSPHSENSSLPFPTGEPPSKPRTKKDLLSTSFSPSQNRPTAASAGLAQPTSYLAAHSASSQPSTTTTPTIAPVSLSFTGTDVFAGIRALAEAGYVDLGRMPAWMTGEEGVSALVVREGVVLEGKGGGP